MSIALLKFAPIIPPSTHFLCLVEAAGQDVSDVLQAMNSTPEGVSGISAAARRKCDGANENSREKISLCSVQLLHVLLSQTLIIRMIRIAKVPFPQSLVAAPLAILTACIMMLGIVVLLNPLETTVEMGTQPLADFSWLFGTLLSCCLLLQCVKRCYIRRCEMWLSL